MLYDIPIFFIHLIPETEMARSLLRTKDHTDQLPERNQVNGGRLLDTPYDLCGWMLTRVAPTPGS